ncbi:hypothetical protein ACEN9J_02880 [Variovorax sp. Varisp41]|uniref:hypothetical protein n=1 Tax=Variovorax sp. Varisp41 TaxID=3243033 RepID=UPI0039B4E6E6
MSTDLLPALEGLLLAWEAKAAKGVGTMINDATTSREHAAAVRAALVSDLSQLQSIAALAGEWEGCCDLIDRVMSDPQSIGESRAMRTCARELRELAVNLAKGASHG